MPPRPLRPPPYPCVARVTLPWPGRPCVVGNVVRRWQLGPYRFLQNEMKLNTSWSEDGDIVRYNRWDYYTPAGPLPASYYQVCAHTCVRSRVQPCVRMGDVRACACPHPAVF